jgi:protein-S-isoprenylcysteine O-methyltransferase Ste14
LAAARTTAPCLAITFLIRRTTLNPFAAPPTFLARGLYRFSRNPMYLGVVLVYLAGTLLVGSLWPLVLLVAPLLILDRVVIPFEEANMRTAFGDSYQSYCAHVRRWV